MTVYIIRVIPRHQVNSSKLERDNLFLSREDAATIEEGWNLTNNPLQAFEFYSLAKARSAIKIVRPNMYKTDDSHTYVPPSYKVEILYDINPM